MKIKHSDISIGHMIEDSLFEPQRTAHSYLHFDLSKLKDIYGNDLRPTATKNIGGYNATDLLRLALSTHGMPDQASEKIEIRKGNEVIKFAGGVTYEDIEVSVTDWVGADMEMLISAWDGLRYNPETGMINPAWKYKQEGSIIQYSTDGEVVRSWKLKGAWINGVKYGSYDRSNASGVREISFTIHVDKAYPEMRELPKI